MLRPLVRLLTSAALILTSVTALACGSDSTAGQIENLHAIASHISKHKKPAHKTAKIERTKPWPASMENGNASYYSGSPQWDVKGNHIKYWAAVPIKSGIAFGICLMVTNKKDPSRHVAVVTADTGGWKVPHRVLDLSTSAGSIVIPNYRKTGATDITAIPVDMSVCKNQS